MVGNFKQSNIKGLGVNNFASSQNQVKMYKN